DDSTVSIITNRLTTLLRHSEKFLPDTQLRILREKDLGDKDLVWRQVARCDCFVVLNPLLWVDQNRGRFLRDSVVVGPPCEDISFRIHQINFNPLVRRKNEA